MEEHRRKDCPIDEVEKLGKIGDIFSDEFNGKVIYDDPYIVRLDNFLSSEEIVALFQRAVGNFSRSTIVVDDKLIDNVNTRTSQTAFLTDNGHKQIYEQHIESIIAKVCYLSGCTRNKMESIMMVKYESGQEYYNHHDYFEPEHKRMLLNGGQRIATFFVWLNDKNEDEGGETEFPLIGVKERPKQGSALFWWNVNKDGQVNSKTLHRGCPVKSGRKFGLNIWVRQDGW